MITNHTYTSNNRPTDTDENKRLHLQMIENTISRMGSNSFLIKGWSLTAIGGLITLYFANIEHAWAYSLLWMAFIICLMFWVIDTYYLQIEHRYRALYDHVRKQSEEDIDFNMHLPATNETFLGCMRRPIFLLSYGFVSVMLLIIIYTTKS